jgi:hypothetical protein
MNRTLSLFASSRISLFDAPVVSGVSERDRDDRVSLSEQVVSTLR